MTILIPESWGDIDAIVIGAIGTSIILSFILLVIIFAMRYKSQNDRVHDLKRLIREKDEKTRLLMENLKRLQESDTAREEQLIRCARLEEICKDEKKELVDSLEFAKSKINKLEAKLSELIQTNETLEKNYIQAKEAMDRAVEEAQKAQKRNEFWVEQLSELRAKYDALKIKDYHRSLAKH